MFFNKFLTSTLSDTDKDLFLIFFVLTKFIHLETIEYDFSLASILELNIFL